MNVMRAQSCIVLGEHWDDGQISHPYCGTPSDCGDTFLDGLLNRLFYHFDRQIRQEKAGCKSFWEIIDNETTEIHKIDRGIFSSVPESVHFLIVFQTMQQQSIGEPHERESS